MISQAGKITAIKDESAGVCIKPPEDKKVCYITLIKAIAGNS